MTLLLVIVRWAHIGGSILLASLFWFELVIAGPLLADPSETPLSGSIRRLIHRLAWRIGLVALISWIGWLWLVSASMSGEDQPVSPDIVGSVLLGTQFGHLWLTRLIVGLIFALTLYFASLEAPGMIFLDRVLATLATLELVGLAWAGHAAANSGAYGLLHLLNDGVHLMVSAFWPGALVPLATYLFLTLKSGKTARMGLAAQITRRFSISSLIAVGVLSVTGFANSCFLVGSLHGLTDSTYGQLLMCKLALFLAMIGFGAWNLLVLKPRLAIDVSAENRADQENEVRVLFRNVLWEIGLGTAVVLVVGMLGITQPPAH
jgi:putative copper resistance protein D